MADANDSNSFGKPCGFDSHLRHNHLLPLFCVIPLITVEFSKVQMPGGSQRVLKNPVLPVIQIG